MVEKMNEFAQKGIPFLFILDFELKHPIIIPLEEAINEGIYFDINGLRNFNNSPRLDKKVEIESFPLPYMEYLKAFSQVKQYLEIGDSYLTNLTFETKIDLNLSLEEIFYSSNAKYRLKLKNEFVVFSPEPFIRIENGIISSYPMKGTISGREHNPKDTLLSNPKEKAEQNTIVDLIRNDLNLVANRVKLDSFRYLERIGTQDQDLYQVSSKISGELKPFYHNRIGSLLEKVLPAGSITGAPKQRTSAIIREVESYQRGYYTGVFGYYSKGYLDSGVMIRFIEKRGEQFFYKSGGGITAFSEPELEYQEMIDKIYVPINRDYQNSPRRDPEPFLASNAI